LTSFSDKILMRFLANSSWLLGCAVFLFFGVLSPKFLEIANLVNILIQSSSAAIVAIGMTFVLLTGGIDLSVGAIMFLSAVVAGKMVLGGSPLPLVMMAIMVIGVVFGSVNAFFITRLKILAFVVTLATLYVGRGLALMISQTRAMNLPETFLHIGSARPIGIPFPILVLAAVLVLSHLLLTRTAYGRQVYAVGNDLASGIKAGIPVYRIQASVYIVSGLLAAVGGIVSVAQLGAVSPTFGNQREFAAVAAAVLGGTSLFGGRGKVFPGTILGAILIQAVENGLVILNADPYIYPLITASIIFLAVMLDSLRRQQFKKLHSRKTRPA